MLFEASERGSRVVNWCMIYGSINRPGPPSAARLIDNSNNKTGPL